MEKEIKIIPPEGYEIDKENSTFECIKFKPLQQKRWRDLGRLMEGYYISDDSRIIVTPFNCCNFKFENYNIFATEKQAKSALAMAQLSQIIANDDRFGGPITDEEWEDDKILKCVIRRQNNRIGCFTCYPTYAFLAFHTSEQRDLFLKENEDLIKDYFML